MTTLVHHEFWRDEVAALSFATAAPNIWSVPAVIHGEGHPALWYALLHLAHSIAPTPLILPIVSVAVAAAAVVLFLVRAPFPPWWKALFVLSALPAYEYSVMARNYGISMLLMFAASSIYTAPRQQPVLLGLVLFLLANTNVHSALLVPLFAAMWFFQEFASNSSTPRAATGRRPFAHLIGIGLGLSGVVVCLATIYPTNHDLISYPLSDTGWQQRALEAVVLPGRYFGNVLLPASTTAAAAFDSLVLYLLAFGLAGEPLLCAAALIGLWLFALLFALVYPGGLRHQGVFLVFVISLYWIHCSRAVTATADPASVRPKKLTPSYWAVRAAFPLVFLLLVGRGALKNIRDVQFPVTESAALGRVIMGDTRLRDAIVIAEPDYMVESLPYYINNPTYLTREMRYGNTVKFTRSARLDISLGDILNCAGELRTKTGRRVVILLAQDLTDSPNEQVVPVSYGWTFRFTSAQRATFLASTERIAQLRAAAGDENYDVYLLK